MESGDRVYAIGDIHGRFDLLQQLMAQIGAHSAARPTPHVLHIVFLGDLVDRGPDSAKVLDLAYTLERNNARVIVLMGNHEESMVKGLAGDVSVFRAWLRFGGAETLRSYGVNARRAGEGVDEYLARARAAVPANLLMWLAKRPLSVQSGDYFFVHAGVRPGAPLHRQSRDDLLWIRDEFLDDPRDHGAVIVHGHSIESDVAIRGNRIGIDTGAYRTGVLTALYLEGGRHEILSTSPGQVNA